MLNSETVHAYRNRHMAYRREHVWERLSDEEYLDENRRGEDVCK